MKKRIIAIALTLSMMLAALTAMTLTSSAADAAENKLLAYVGTLTVDGLGGKEEAHAVVDTVIGETARIGASWDYDYIYITVAGIEKEHVTDVELTLGGANVTVEGIPADGETDVPTVDGVEGALVEAVSDYVEIAVPLSEITLDIADGSVTAALTATVATEAEDIDYEATLVITGRSTFAKLSQFDGFGLNGYNGFWQNLFVGDVSGVVWNANTDTHKSLFQDNTLHLYDASNDNKVRANMLTMKMYELIDVNEDGSYALSFDLNIEDLPNGPIPTAAPNHGDGASVASPLFAIAIGARKVMTSGQGPSLMFTNDADKGIMLTAVVDGGFVSSMETVALGVKTGEAFNFTVEQRPDGTFAILVNNKEVKVITGKVSKTEAFSGFPSFVMFSILRGSQFDVGAKTSVKCTAYTMSTLTEVDADMLASLAKNGADAPANELKATPATVTVDGSKAEAYVSGLNVGSLTKVYALVDVDADTLNLYARTANLEKLAVKIGDKTLNVALADTKDESAGADKWRPTVTATAEGIEGATAVINKNSQGSIEIAIPLSAITLTDDKADIAITAERSYAFAGTEDEDHTLSLTSITVDGTLVIDKNPPETTPDETTPEDTTPEATTPADTTKTDDTTAADDTSADETPADSAADTTEAEKGGCGSSLAGYCLALVLGSAVVATVASKKKKD